jgi:hypothetical protein
VASLHLLDLGGARPFGFQTAGGLPAQGKSLKPSQMARVPPFGSPRDRGMGGIAVGIESVDRRAPGRMIPLLRAAAER